MNIIGIDPGANGAMVLMLSDGKVADYHCFKEGTERDMIESLLEYKVWNGEKTYVYLEKVHAMPKQGVVSVWTFAHQHGMIEGSLLSHRIPYELVTPQTWQKVMGCMSHGDKNVTKMKAQQIFPDIHVTHSNADALLIAEYGRRIHK